VLRYLQQLQRYRPLQSNLIPLEIAVSQLLTLPAMALLLDYKRVDSRVVSLAGLGQHKVINAYSRFCCTVKPRPTEANVQDRRNLQSLALFVDFACYDVTEQFPALALEFPELKLLDRSEISRAGVYRYAGQEQF